VEEDGLGPAAAKQMRTLARLTAWRAERQQGRGQQSAEEVPLGGGLPRWTAASGLGLGACGAVEDWLG
jgi:hypothetical protein